MGVTEKIDSGKAIMYAYAAIAIGDILIGFISQWFRSRKKALYLFYCITAVFMVLFFTTQWGGSADRMYWICAGLGFGTGFWAIFVTMGAEHQFAGNGGYNYSKHGAWHAGCCHYSIVQSIERPGRRLCDRRLAYRHHHYADNNNRSHIYARNIWQGFELC
jgi:hypothetical protein